MTLQPGTRLGSHEIVAPIGAGGIGEVYRARDTKLGRDVALKVLPAELASSPERLERFQREARRGRAESRAHRELREQREFTVLHEFVMWVAPPL